MALPTTALLAGLLWVVPRTSEPPSLLLVTIDTLRADHLGSYGHAGASTPVLDALARRGTRFARAEAAVPLTGPSHATIFTGLYPPAHGVRDNVLFPLQERHVTLATILKRRGYHTAAFVGAYPVASTFGFGRGFDEFDETLSVTPAGAHGAERPANEVADAALSWHSKAPAEPFFAWLHFYDPHAPYAPPPPFDGSFSGRPYDGEIAFTDAQVGRVLSALEASGRARRTLVAVVSDHGEALGDHGEAAHGILVYESTLHVPLVLAGPGVPSGRVVEERVGTTDLLPTILGLLGIPAPGGLLGRDLRPALEGRRLPPEPLYAESLFGRLNCRWSSLRSWTEGDWKLIRGSRPELFNLAEDPHELRDRAPDEPQRVARMGAALDAALARLAPAGDSARTVRISTEQEERLRSLGYTAGTGGAGALDEPGLPDPRTRVHIYDRIQVLLGARGSGIDAAIEELAELAREDPGNPHAHSSLASMAYRRGRFRLAAQGYERALELDPERPGIRAAYGRLLRDMGRLPDAEREFRIALAQTTADDVGARARLAEALIVQGKSEEAESLLREGLRREPNHRDLLIAMGKLLLFRGRAEEGIARLESAARGADPDPWIELASALLSHGEPSRALAASEEAVRRNPGHPWALAVQGHALVALGRRDEGVAVLQKSLSIGPRRPDVWLSLALAFEAAGLPRFAAQCRREASVIARG